MAKLIKVAESIFNIRGSFKIGPIDVGTQSSLVKRQNGKWLMIDCVQFAPDVKAQVDSLTGGNVEAILNVHPFHTVSIPWAHDAYPNAVLYGTSRHQSKLPSLPWQAGLLDDPDVRSQFKDDLDMRIPKGVDFVSSNEAVHFSSVVVYHKASRTIHVDDTFMFLPTPKIAEVLNLKQGTVQLHPTLAGALERRAGASEDLRAWVKQVVADWDAVNLLAAHSGALLAVSNTGEPIPSRLTFALTLAEPVLKAHELIYGKSNP